MNPYLKNRMTAIQQVLMAHHTGGIGMPDAVKGNEREMFVREFLRRIFPSHFRFTSGAITDSEGRLTGQVDIAIEYPTIASFPMPNGEERLMLAESVMAAIEVKSDLAKQWDQVTATVEKIKMLRRSLSSIAVSPVECAVRIPCIAVGFVGYKTEQGLLDRLALTPLEQRPDAVLMIDTGYFTGLGLGACGPSGLFALCVALTRLATNLEAKAPDMMNYLHCQHP